MEASPPNRAQLERELEDARRLGRWLSDDERAALALAMQQQAESALAQRRHRRKLWVLTAVSALIPPLWPLALGMVFYLLFPRTTKRFGLIVGIALLVVGVLLSVLVLTLVVALLMVLF